MMNSATKKTTKKVAKKAPARRVPRALLIIDGGWMAAGDVREDGRRIVLDRAVWLFKFERIGLAEAVANPESPEVDLRPFPNGFVVPAAAELFRVPLPQDWGMFVYNK